MIATVRTYVYAPPRPRTYLIVMLPGNVYGCLGGACGAYDRWFGPIAQRMHTHPTYYDWDLLRTVGRLAATRFGVRAFTRPTTMFATVRGHRLFVAVTARTRRRVATFVDATLREVLTMAGHARIVDAVVGSATAPAAPRPRASRTTGARRS